MLPVFVDENLDQRILRGLRLQVSNLNYVIVQETELRSSGDPTLLEWAAEHQRVVVTHDVNTIPKYAYERIRMGEPVAGVVIVPEDLAIGIAIEELVRADRMQRDGRASQSGEIHSNLKSTSYFRIELLDSHRRFPFP
jgi:predicted nuclease of predicted toxin-antitoxin system